ncbi:MAG: hypothetical protein ACYS99_01135 [Planctomycetota bacterium]
MRYGALLVASISLLGCASSSAPPGGRGLRPQIKASADGFFKALETKGVRAHSHFAVFVPDGAVNIRHLKKFRRAVEDGVRAATADTSLSPVFSAAKVFLLSDQKAKDWDSADLGDEPGEVLAREWTNGTKAGWTAFHAYWAQFNRLAIGDKTWIDGLPDSVRSDLSNPLTYVLVVNVHLDERRDATTYLHTLSLQLVEVGSERSLSSEDYPLELTYPLP